MFNLYSQEIIVALMIILIVMVGADGALRYKFQSNEVDAIRAISVQCKRVKL